MISQDQSLLQRRQGGAWKLLNLIGQHFDIGIDRFASVQLSLNFVYFVTLLTPG